MKEQQRIGPGLPPRNCLKHIHWLTRVEVPQVLEIERYMLDTWSEEMIVKAMRRRNQMAFVLTESKWVQGWMIVEMRKESYVLHRLCVHPFYQRRDVGSLLIKKLIDKLAYDKRTVIEARVPDDLLSVHLFFRYCGFRAIGVEGSEYVFEYRII